MDERERRLRRTFGPAPGTPARPPASRRRWPRPRLAVVAAIALVLVVLAVPAVFWAVTPRDHVASGCLWWTAKTLGQLLPGDRGCVRGYVIKGGGLAEAPDEQGYRLSFLLSEPDTESSRPPCPFQPGDAVVVRYHAIFDDGRTIVIVDDCR